MLADTTRPADCAGRRGASVAKSMVEPSPCAAPLSELPTVSPKSFSSSGASHECLSSSSSPSGSGYTSAASTSIPASSSNCREGVGLHGQQPEQEQGATPSRWGRQELRLRSYSPGPAGRRRCMSSSPPRRNRLAAGASRHRVQAALKAPSRSAAKYVPAADVRAMEAQLHASDVKNRALLREIEALKDELRASRSRVAVAEEMARESRKKSESLLHRRNEICDKFDILRKKYDGVKNHLREVLWDYIPNHRLPGVEGRGPEWLEGIPPIDHSLDEGPCSIGKYQFGETLGEGQFAAVRSVIGHANLAVKVIHKGSVVNLTALRRVDNEIAALRELDHPGVMRLHRVMHGQENVYLVTDRAHRDLFDFFDSHLEGVSEASAAVLLRKILLPVAHCHRRGFCHRDLKPENILFCSDSAAELTDDTHIVICDFGLCARVENDAEEALLLREKRRPRMLREFCGSPGFFAPEMLSCGLYDGKKADVWSVGCILLELVLGHEDFCRLWMSAYDYGKLQNPELFREAVELALVGLAKLLNERVSPPLADLLLWMLSLSPDQRPFITDVVKHEWLQEGDAEGPKVHRQLSAHLTIRVPKYASADTSKSYCGQGDVSPPGSYSGSDEEIDYSMVFPHPPSIRAQLIKESIEAREDDEGQLSSDMGDRTSTEGFSFVTDVSPQPAVTAGEITITMSAARAKQMEPSYFAPPPISPATPHITHASASTAWRRCGSLGDCSITSMASLECSEEASEELADVEGDADMDGQVLKMLRVMRESTIQPCQGFTNS
jgi:serine/threonine protein kinase